MDKVSAGGAAAPAIVRLDHLVLTCEDAAATVSFYERVMGFTGVETGGRWALRFGQQTIHLHQRGREMEPHAMEPTPGSGDLCFLTEAPLEQWLEHLLLEGVVIAEGPVARAGAMGPMQSVYVRDPDGNLIEIARYAEQTGG